MQILTVDTGNAKLDDAYKRMQVHICSFDKVDEFMNYFLTITKEANQEELFKWLLKVLYWEFKHGRENSTVKNDWDILLDVCSDEQRDKLIVWMNEQLVKKGVYVNGI